MANVLGSLFVELGINTAAFVEGVSKATYQAKAGAQQIGASFSALGGQIAQIGAHFGEFGTIVGQSIAAVGSNISKLIPEFGKLSGAAGAAKLGGVGLVALAAGAVTAAGAVIGIAVHASEAAARIYQLSQSTGVAVKDLSGLGIVSQLVGLNIETLSKGLERMDRSALAAAKSPNAATNAYKQLGISVLDTSGHLKPTVELFGEVADKFSVMQDSATKTALAMQIFGRAGAELIPVLNKGSAALKYWMDYGTQVGAILDEKTAAGAEAFRNELTKLGLISDGVQNKLMIALLPALDHITAALTEFASHGNTIVSFGEVVGQTLTTLASLVFQTAYAWSWWGEQIKKAGAIAVLVARGDFKAIPEAVRQINDEVKAESEKLEATLAALNSKTITAPGPEGPKRTGEPPLTQRVNAPVAKTSTDEVDKYIATLESETAGQLKLMGSIANTTQAIKEQEAQLAAENEVDKLREGLITKQASLEKNLADAKASGGAQGERAAKQASVELNFIGQQITALDKNRDYIISLIETKKKAAEDESFAKSMVAEREKIEANIKGLQAESAAVFQNAATKRAAAVTAAGEKLQAEHPEANIAPVIAALKAQSDAQYNLQVAQKAADLATNKGYTDQISLLNAVKAANTNNRDIQLAADAEILAANNKVTASWDANALAVGTMGEKAKAVLNQLSIESQNVGGKIAESFKNMLDGVSTEFAKMVTTGKFNFTQLFQSLEEAIIKQLASKALSDLLNKVASIGSSSSGDNSGDNSGGGTGGFFKMIVGALFGGGKAVGGPVSPGVTYLVGEQGPELLRMGSAGGTVVPNAATIAGSPTQTPNVNIHVHGATDPDTFRKATPQIAAAAFQALRGAYARNGGL